MLRFELEKWSPTAGVQLWVKHVAESESLRRAARDLPPNVAQCLLGIVQDVRPFSLEPV